MAGQKKAGKKKSLEENQRRMWMNTGDKNALRCDFMENMIK